MKQSIWRDLLVGFIGSVCCFLAYTVWELAIAHQVLAERLIHVQQVVIEHKENMLNLVKRTEKRWTSTDQVIWAEELEKRNPELNVPTPRPQ